jgi:protein TonB
MIKTKAAVNLLIFFLVLGAAFSLYVSNRSRPLTQSPVFVYEEVTARPVATRITPARPVALSPKPATAPLPMVAPQVISQVLPEYPASALEKGVEGTTLIQARINALGNPEDVMIKISSGKAELDQAAVKAVALWKFSPANQGGTAITSIFEVPVRFSIK